MNSAPSVQKELFIYYLNKIYDGKSYLRDCIPDVIKATIHNKLRLALVEMQSDINNQLQRMQKIYDLLDAEPETVFDAPIKSIIKNACELRANPDKTILNEIDTMIHMQLVEHVNIITYRMLRKLASLLGYDQIDQLLRECFDESNDDDQLFVELTNEFLSNPQ